MAITIDCDLYKLSPPRLKATIEQIKDGLTLHRPEIRGSFEHWPPGATESLVFSLLEPGTSFLKALINRPSRSAWQ